MHTRYCLARSVISAVENLRDTDSHMGPGYEEALDRGFAEQVSDGTLLTVALEYLESGTITCTCGSL